MGYIGQIRKLDLTDTENEDLRKLMITNDALERIGSVDLQLRSVHLWIALYWRALGEEACAEESIKRADTVKMTTALDYFLLGQYHEFQRHAKPKALEAYFQALDILFVSSANGRSLAIGCTRRVSV